MCQLVPARNTSLGFSLFEIVARAASKPLTGRLVDTPGLNKAIICYDFKGKHVYLVVAYIISIVLKVQMEQLY